MEEVTVKKSLRNKLWWLSVLFFLGSVASLSMGFYKMFAYENSEYSFATKTNVYVGGDAYNYIINGTYATAYFVLFGALLLAGLIIELIIVVHNGLNKSIISIEDKNHEKEKSKLQQFMDEVKI